MPGFMVVDNFIPNPDKVRASALQSGFGTWRPNKGDVGSSIYDGMNFWGDHATLLKGLTQAAGETIYPNSMFFRITNETTESAYVHSDRHSGDYTAIVYLSQHDPESSGTEFYRHRETGWVRMPPLDEIAKDPVFFERFAREMVEGRDEVWERIGFIHGKYNRALIFDAPVFHSRFPKHGFGDTAASGRMVWACHFLGSHNG